MRRKDILKNVMASDAEKIKYTYEHLNEDAFNLAVKTIAGGRHIYIIGLRGCAPLASFLAFQLNLILENVRLLQTSSPSELFEQMLYIGERDVIVGISFPRYSMRTLKALEFANKRNAKVITITDDEHSPINLYSSCTLTARSDLTSIADSLVAPMSLINALVVALCMNKRKRLLGRLGELEELWEDYQTYDLDDLYPMEEEISLKPEKGGKS